MQCGVRVCKRKEAPPEGGGGEAAPSKEGVDRSDRAEASPPNGGGDGEVHLSFSCGAPFLLILLRCVFSLSPLEPLPVGWCPFRFAKKNLRFVG